MSGYENYTLSPVPWIKQMPEHWGLVRGKNLYQKMQRPTSDTDEVVTCFRDGTVTLRKNRRTTGFTESLKEIGYQGIRKGDLVIHVMDAFAGSIGFLILMEKVLLFIVSAKRKAIVIINIMPCCFGKWHVQGISSRCIEV